MDLNYEGMDKDLRDTLVDGKYVFGVDGVDFEYVSTNKGTRGIHVQLHVIEGPYQDEEQTINPMGSTKFLDLWYPTPTQKDGGTMCKKRINAWLDSMGLHDARLAGTPINETLILGQSFVCKVKAATMKDSDREKEEYFDFEPVGGA
jgi:hypothetical protein